MRKFFLLVLTVSFALGVYARTDHTTTLGKCNLATAPDPHRVIWMGASEESLGTQNSEEKMSFDALTAEDCEEARQKYENAIAAPDSDPLGLSYEAVYCELRTGMTTEDAIAIFERYQLKKQNWVKQGSTLEWWNWKWRQPENGKEHEILSATLDVEFRDNLLKRGMFDLVSSKRTLHCVNGSLDTK